MELLFIGNAIGRADKKIKDMQASTRIQIKWR